MPQESQLGLGDLGIYLIEGVVEKDPITDKVYVRTIGDNGVPVDFDPVPVLSSLVGQEIRVIVVPLASLATLEELISKATGEKPC